MRKERETEGERGGERGREREHHRPEEGWTMEDGGRE